MIDPQVDPERRKMVLTSQIIVAALFAGCLSFLLIVLLIMPGKLDGWDLGLSKPMTSVALVVAFLLIILMHLPTPFRVNDWIGQQTLAIKEQVR
ncbi:MAG: hypothetical protein WCJ35_19360 [Planctomycetota bacterium]